MPSLGDSPPAPACSKRPARGDDENHRDDEVGNFHDFVKSGHRALEEIDEQRDDEAAYERGEERSEVASVKEAASDLAHWVVGMRVAHADNLNFPLAIVPVAAT